MAKASLLDDILNHPIKPRHKTWLTRLPEKAQAELQSVKEAWLAGKIDKPASIVHAAIVAKYPVTVRACEIRRWLNG